MSDYINVKIHKEDFLDALMENIRELNSNKTDYVYQLFKTYYMDEIENGTYEGTILATRYVADHDFLYFEPYRSKEEALNDYSKNEEDEEFRKRIKAELPTGEVLIDTL